MLFSRKYYFLTVVETRNITKAAEILRVSQPSLSQYISNLERELQVKLMDRSGSPLRLTKAGEIYAEYLRVAQNNEKNLMEALEYERTSQVQPLTVGIPLQVTPLFAKTVFPSFVEGDFDFNIAFWEGTSLSVKRRILSGELELGFAHTLPLENADLRIEPLESEHVFLLCNKSNPLLNGEKAHMGYPLSVLPQAIENSTLYVLSEDYLLHEVAMDYLHRYAIRMKHTIILSNLRAILELIAEDRQNCVTFIPDFILQGYTRTEELAFIRIGDDIDWHFSVMCRKDRKLSAKASAFWKRVIRIYQTNEKN